MDWRSFPESQSLKPQTWWWCFGICCNVASVVVFVVFFSEGLLLVRLLFLVAPSTYGLLYCIFLLFSFFFLSMKFTSNLLRSCRPIGERIEPAIAASEKPTRFESDAWKIWCWDDLITKWHLAFPFLSSWFAVVVVCLFVFVFLETTFRSWCPLRSRAGWTHRPRKPWAERKFAEQQQNN